MRERRWPRRLIPAHRDEWIRYLAGLAPLFGVCDLVGTTLWYLQVPWSWDLPTALGSCIFVGTAGVFLMFFGELQATKVTLSDSLRNANLRLFDSVLKAHLEDEKKDISSGLWWALWGGTFIGVLLVLIASPNAGVVLAYLLIPAGLVGLVPVLRARLRSTAVP